MAVPARLKWRKENGRFTAYPLGFHTEDRFALIEHKVHVNRANPWFWKVTWPGWFNDDGLAANKQAAADAATEAWWRLVITPIPRDIEMEIAVIVARVLVMPPPNSLLSEESDYLRKVMHSLRLQYEQELRQETLPAPVRNLMANLSEELYRRRTGDGPAEVQSATRILLLEGEQYGRETAEVGQGPFLQHRFRQGLGIARAVLGAGEAKHEAAKEAKRLKRIEDRRNTRP